MADATAISWCDVTFNPWLGCEKVSPACAHCYAETLAENRMGLRGDSAVWGRYAARRVTSESTWAKPHTWNRASAASGRERFGGESGERIRVFCASMADVFEPRPDLEEPRRRLFALIEATPALDWLVLTKRPEVAAGWLRRFWETREHDSLLEPEWHYRDGIPWGVLPNLWVGASIENARFTVRADALREIPAPVRFVSAEPLLGSLYPYRPWNAPFPSDGNPRANLNLDGIDWLIVGGESGGRASRPMHPEWARELRDRALAEGVSFHFKQWGSWGPTDSCVLRDGDLCWTLADPETGRPEIRSVVGPDYVCAPNESDGEWLRYLGAAPKAGGKLLDDVEYCDFPRQAVTA